MKRDVLIAAALVAASLAVAGVARADEGAGPDLLAGHTRHPGLDTFHVLGFSRAGAFAYLVDGCGDEAGYRCTSVHVVDLVRDRPLDSLQWDVLDDSEASGSLQGHEAEVRALLARHGIALDGPDGPAARGKVVVGDRFEAEQRFRVVVTERDTRSDDDGFDRTSVVSLVRGEHAKRIATLHEDGFLDAGGPRPLAVALSPWERRAAVLLVDWQYAGCIGGRPRVLVVGADLDARYP